MKSKLFYILTLVVSFNSYAADESDINSDKNYLYQQDVLQTAKLMDDINLLKLKLEKEKIEKSLNEELLSNIEVKKQIDKQLNRSSGKAKVYDPADGPFNSNGIRLLSVTSLQNSQKMAVFSFYGRKFNLAQGDKFKNSTIDIDDSNVVFNYNGKKFKYSY
ncbi:hypothetical protein HGG78_16995 [Vibrio aestuarianus]|uniref:hypothetical protein n=1 Tax=Vibrio aestuarianus TaxID=28171 RepID=UPI001559755E|nr:hypothetical protein [Vibrio aestuarianus]NGZ15426.1 hypothetical protein [Vibrio aestuarianus]NKZ51574.1 hypothetical protein [Vibrio aestuarianus]